MANLQIILYLLGFIIIYGIIAVTFYFCKINNYLQFSRMDKLLCITILAIMPFAELVYLANNELKKLSSETGIYNIICNAEKDIFNNNDNIIYFWRFMTIIVPIILLLSLVTYIIAGMIINSPIKVFNYLIIGASEFYFFETDRINLMNLCISLLGLSLLCCFGNYVKYNLSKKKLLATLPLLVLFFMAIITGDITWNIIYVSIIKVLLISLCFSFVLKYIFKLKSTYRRLGNVILLCVIIILQKML